LQNNQYKSCTVIDWLAKNCSIFKQFPFQLVQDNDGDKMELVQFIQNILAVSSSGNSFFMVYFIKNVWFHLKISSIKMKVWSNRSSCSRNHLFLDIKIFDDANSATEAVSLTESSSTKCFFIVCFIKNAIFRFQTALPKKINNGLIEVLVLDFIKFRLLFNENFKALYKPSKRNGLAFTEQPYLLFQRENFLHHLLHQKCWISIPNNL